MGPQIRELKVKVKSLSVEAAIIRKEERKLRRKLEWLERKYKDTQIELPAYYDAKRETLAEIANLRNHRVVDVRNEQRSAFLAYGFIRGQSYKTIEGTSKNAPDYNRLRTLIAKFGNPAYRGNYAISNDTLIAWVKGTLEVHPFAKNKESNVT